MLTRGIISLYAFIIISLGYQQKKSVRISGVYSVIPNYKELESMQKGIREI